MKAGNRRAIFYSFNLIPAFIWIGFVCAISFMEAWLKFRAPQVTLAVGLSIGKLIFGALNTVEWCFALSILVLTFASGKKITFKKSIFFILPILLLILQTLYLLPALNERTDIILQGLEAPASTAHIYYIAFEFIKVVSLFIFGAKIICDLAVKQA